MYIYLVVLYVIFILDKNYVYVYCVLIVLFLFIDLKEFMIFCWINVIVRFWIVKKEISLLKFLFKYKKL